MDPVYITGNLSRGLRNLSRGLRCEETALQYYLNQNYILLKKRWRSPFAEIDLVLRSSEGILTLVEVKSLINPDFLHVRLTQVQIRRLRKAVLFSLERDPTCCLELAMVDPKGEVDGCVAGPCTLKEFVTLEGESLNMVGAGSRCYS